ncbi:MAG TPA: PIN domain-containing protein [Thermoanaerobaculia bacterium]|nr:PIN domain-containing protein [Thermoanaerobaculia bacterium]
MIVLDTSVLSRALRRRPRTEQADPAAEKLELVLRGNVAVAIPGIVLQEVLSGVRTEKQFADLQDKLEAFPLVMAAVDDHVDAARLVTRCRATGIAVTAIDALIAVMTIRVDGDLFTLDRDFARMAELVPLRLVTLHDEGG